MQIFIFYFAIELEIPRESMKSNLKLQCLSTSINRQMYTRIFVDFLEFFYGIKIFLAQNH
jgi:hypothetical protein